jgi:hypothetical protein
MTEGTFANTQHVGRKIVPSRQESRAHPDLVSLVSLVRTFLQAHRGSAVEINRQASTWEVDFLRFLRTFRTFLQ